MIPGRGWMDGLADLRAVARHLRLLAEEPLCVLEHARGVRTRLRTTMTDQSDAGSTNQTQEARVYSHDRPIRRGKRGYVLRDCNAHSGALVQSGPVRRTIRGRRRRAPTLNS
eukprot:1188130-Prorocentrum_minimum.AAC.2